MKPGKRRESIENNKDLIELSFELIGLNINIGIDINIDELKYNHPNSKMLGDFINKNGFKSLKPRAEGLFSIKIEEQENIEPAKDIIVKQIKSKEDLKLLTQKIEEAGIVAILLNEIEGEKKEIEVAIDGKTSYYVEIDLKDPDRLELFDFSNKEQTNWWTNYISQIFEDKSILKITYDAKSLLKQFSKVINIDSFSAIEDIMLMNYVISAGNPLLDLKDIIAKYRHSHLEIDPKKITPLMLDTHKDLKSAMLENQALDLYYNIDLPLLRVLYEMENIGIKIDPIYLRNLSNDFEGQIKNITEKIFQISNKEFNIASSKQLGEILFEHLKIPGGKKLAKSGSYGTGIDILEKLSEENHQIADYLIDNSKDNMPSFYEKIDLLLQRLHI
jgi:DNA polymerase-1